MESKYRLITEAKYGQTFLGIRWELLKARTNHDGGQRFCEVGACRRGRYALDR